LVQGAQVIVGVQVEVLALLKAMTKENIEYCQKLVEIYRLGHFSLLFLTIWMSHRISLKKNLNSENFFHFFENSGGGQKILWPPQSDFWGEGGGGMAPPPWPPGSSTPGTGILQV
jgi:hypothetical protein